MAKFNWNRYRDLVFEAIIKPLSKADREELDKMKSDLKKHKR